MMSDYTPDKYDQPHMVWWRDRRMNSILNHYGETYFHGKKLLEVASALGEIGNRFHELGAEVTCTDHFEKWVLEIKKRYPHITAKIQDINEPWELCFSEKYDILVHMGVIYHQPPELVEVRLKEACEFCKEIIIETLASDSNDPYLIERVEKPPRVEWWEPVYTDYSCPSTAFIERILTEMGMEFIRVDSDTGRYLWFAKHI